MEDYEQDDPVDKSPSGRDRVPSSPVSPGQSEGRRTRGASVGAGQEGPKNATIYYIQTYYLAINLQSLFVYTTTYYVNQDE